jgi:D-alanyl-D-alanine carboxypeptidase
MPTSVRTAPDNLVDAEVDARLTALLDRTVARRGIHHANLAIASGDGPTAGPAPPGRRDRTAPRSPPTPPSSSPASPSGSSSPWSCRPTNAASCTSTTRSRPPATETITDGLHVFKGTDHTPTITIRHLASHTSGLPDHFEKPRRGPSLFEQLAAGQDRAWTFDDVVRMAREQHRPHFAPQDLTATRQRARYSDTGFQLLIRIVETVTGHSYGQLLTDRILEPARARAHLAAGPVPAAGPVATPSTIYAKDRPLDLPQMVESCNDLISTTDDLLRFHRALLAGEPFRTPHRRPADRTANLLRNAFRCATGSGP